MQAFARALIFRAPGLFAPHACAARVSIVPRRLTRDLTANAGGWSIGPGGRVGGGGGGRERDDRDDRLLRNRWGDEYEDDGRDRGGYDEPARGVDRRAGGPSRGRGGGRGRGRDEPRRAEAPRRRGESSTRGRGGRGPGRGRGRDDLRERPSRDRFDDRRFDDRRFDDRRFDDRRFDDGPLIVPPKDTRQVPSRRGSSAPSRGRGQRGGRGDGYDRGGYDPRDRAPPRRRGGYDRPDGPVRSRSPSASRDGKHDPFAGGPRPTPGHHDPRYDYRDHAPPERTNERGPRSTGIADAYYAAYLRGEVDLADPPELDVYPRDEPDFNPVGPRWRMPDGTWFGEGPPDPRRTFDREAHEKKVYWGTKEELMRAERVAIGLEEPYVHPDDVIVKLISRPEGYWTITAKDEREGKPGTFTATPEVAEKVRRAMEEGDEAPTWASTSSKSPFQGKSEKNDETNEANFERPRRASSSSTALGDYYATCHPGLEDVVAAELESPLIGASDVRVGSSGVSFRGDARVGYRANVWLRSAVRVLCELDRGYIDPNVPGGAAIYEFVRDAAPWHEVIPADDGLTFSVESRVRSCADVTSTRLASTRAKDAICDALVDVNGWRPPPPRFGHSSADVPLYLSLFRDEAKLYRDMSGESLHRRGYRDAAIHRAALNEAAAAGVLSLAGWAAACDRARERGTSLPALVDPMCGSGTLLIEGAMMAGRVAPGLIRVDAARGFGKVRGGGDEGGGEGGRAFAFERWPDHDPTLLEEVLEEAAEIGAAARKKMGGAPVIVGNDVHAGALSLARRAAMAAGVDGIIDFVQGDAADLTHPKLTEFTAAALERDGLTDSAEPVDLDDLGPTALRAEGGGVLVVSNPPWGMRIGARDDGYDGDDAGDGYGDGNWDESSESATSIPGSVRGGEGVEGREPPVAAPRAPDVEEAWQSLGAFFRRECGGATAHLLSGDANATRPLRMRARRKRVLGIGGVDCRLLEYRILPPRRRASLEELADAAREEEE